MLVSYWTVALVAAFLKVAEACMCMPEHPQTLFCNSDFVIVGRVQRIYKGNDSNEINTYKVKIRNKFKATRKAMVALKSGLLLTPSDESMCGVALKPRETYVITGRVVHLQAHINLCGYTKKWREVTRRQRKGFRMLYKQGCSCKVRVSGMRSRSPNTCVSQFGDCYERHGICLNDRDQKCKWTRAPALTRCLQAKRFNGTTT